MELGACPMNPLENLSDGFWVHVKKEVDHSNLYQELNFRRHSTVEMERGKIRPLLPYIVEIPP